MATNRLAFSVFPSGYPNAVRIPMKILDPHRENLIRTHSAVRQDNHHKPGLLTHTLGSAMVGWDSVGAFQMVLGFVVN
jgi:hypothetical protein